MRGPHYLQEVVSEDRTFIPVTCDVIESVPEAEARVEAVTDTG